MELAKGKGRIVVCQLDVTKRYGIDPVATKVVNNIFNYTAIVEPRQVVKTGYYGAENVYLKILEDSKSEFDKLTDLSTLKKYGLLILSPENFNELNSVKSEIGNFVRKGGKVLCLLGKGNREESFKWLPFEISAKRIRRYNAFPDKENKLIRGLGNSDFYWRAVKNMYVFGSNVEKIVNPGIISTKEYGKGEYIFCGINPDNFVPAKNSSFIYDEVHQKTIRIISTLLTNLGVNSNAVSLFGNEWYMNNEKKAGSVSIDLNNWKFNIDPDDKGISNNWFKKGFNDNDWKEINVPSFWENQGFTMVNPNTDYSKEPKNFQPGGAKYLPYDGYAWYRIKINIPETYKGSKFVFAAGTIDDLDWTYFNGKEIGRTTLKESKTPWIAKRNYPIPEKLIEFGKDNYLVVRVFDIHGNGGIGVAPIQINIIKQKKQQQEKTGKNISLYIKELNKYDVNAFHNW